MEIYRPEENGLSDALNQYYKCIYDLGSPEDVEKIDAKKYHALIMYTGDDALSARLVYKFVSQQLPVIAIEEGNQLSLNDKKLNFYGLPHTLLLTVSERERELFIECGHAPERVTTVGLAKYTSPPSITAVIALREKLHIDSNKKIVLYASSPLQRFIAHSYETWENRKCVFRYLQSVGKNDVQIVVKLHPREDIEAETKRVKELLPAAIVLGGDFSVHELISIAGVVINRGNSQIALEAIWLKTPLIIIPQKLRTIFDAQQKISVCHSLVDFKSSLQEALNGEQEKPSQDFFKAHFQQDIDASEMIATKIKKVKAAELSGTDFFLWAIIFLEKRQSRMALEAFKAAAKLGHLHALQALECLNKPNLQQWRTLALKTGVIQFVLEAVKAACEQGALDKAIQCFDDINNDFHWALRHEKLFVIDLFKAAVLRRAKRFSEALKIYDELLVQAPEYCQLHLQKALTLQESARNTEARLTLEFFREMNPNNQQISTALKELESKSFVGNSFL
ncbi:MAG: hypothetical protein HRT88_09980 [Lentisphaeraceae bacterium]|nr:hypothetical protein [Lentisphaeraceae bacterium]